MRIKKTLATSTIMPFFRQREPLCDPLGAFGAAPTTGRQAGESKYAEHALQKIYAVMLVVISELE